MSYLRHHDPKTKKAFKELVSSPEKIVPVQALTGAPEPDGIGYIEGPRFPAPHKWYARVKIENGEIVKVLS